MANHPAQTGDHWVADELMVDVGGEKAWLWNVMDGKTRYVLASHLSRERDGEAAKAVMRKALANADKPPDYIFTDKLRSYLPALREVLPKTKHHQSQGFAADINNNLSERLQGTFRDRVKTLRGLDTIESGQRYLDGWVITYNNFRGHESLGNQTPAYRAKVNPPFTEWADVVKGDAVYPTLVTKTDARLAEPPKLSQQEVKPTAQAPKCRPVKPQTAKRNGRAATKHPYYNLRKRGAKARRR